MKGLPHEEIAKIPKSRLRNAIVKALPDDLKDKIDAQQLKIQFEELDDYTEMKVTTDAKDPEQADDLKWTMLDPIHVRKFNEELKNDQETDLMACEYTYLDRRISFIEMLYSFFCLCLRRYQSWRICTPMTKQRSYSKYFILTLDYRKAVGSGFVFFIKMLDFHYNVIFEKIIYGMMKIFRKCPQGSFKPDSII